MTNFVAEFTIRDTASAEDGKSRRHFLGTAAAVVGGALGLGGTASPSASASVPPGQGNPQRHWGMVIDLRRCVACRACVVSCKNENKTPPSLSYNRFIEEDTGEFPLLRHVGITQPCMHCEKPSCLESCPAEAIYKRADGLVVVDYENCAGAQECVKACPYQAIHFDEGHNYIQDSANAFNSIPSSEFGAAFGVRAKDRSPIGNARKCTFCLHLQDENGEYREPTACTRTCMGRAIHFGDLKDPEATCVAHGEKMQELLAHRAHFRLKEELPNHPTVYYLK